MEPAYQYFFLFTLLAYIITYAVGHVLVSFIKFPERYPFLKEFTKMSVGIYFTFIVYAVFRSRGITINVGLLVLSLFLFIYFKRKSGLRTIGTAIAEMKRLRFAYLLAQIAAAAAVFVLLWFRLKQYPGPGLTIVHQDFFCYATFIEQLNKTGIESRFPDWFNHIPQARTLYHFGELWYSAAYAAIFNMNAFFAFYLLTFTHFLVVYILGGAAILELYFTPKKKSYYLLALCMIFVCGLCFFIPRDFIFTRGDWWDNGLIFQPKYFFIALSILYALLLLRLRLYFILIVVEMATVLSCTVAAPSLLIASGLLIIAWWAMKEITFREAAVLSAVVAINLICIGVYALLTSSAEHSDPIAGVPPAKITAGLGVDASYLKTAFNCFAGQFIKSILSLALYFILLIVAVKKIFINKSWRSPIIALFIIHIASLLSYAIFFKRIDAVQLWSIVYIPLSAIVCFLVVCFLITQKSVYKVGVLALLALSVVQSRLFSHGMITIREDMHQRLIPHYDGSPAVYFKEGQDFYTDIFKNVNAYVPYLPMKIYYKNYLPACLTVTLMPRDTANSIIQNLEEEIIRNAPFYRYMEHQKNMGKFVSMEQSQLDFIREHHVHYAFVYSSSQLPASLVSRATIVLKDSVDRITLYKLN